MVSKAKLEKFHKYLWSSQGHRTEGVIYSRMFKDVLQIMCDVDPDRTETLRSALTKMSNLDMISDWEGNLVKPLGIRTITITNPYLDEEKTIERMEKRIEDFEAKMREEKES